MFICKKCEKEPIVRGMKTVKCLRCKNDSFIAYENLDLCEDCCREGNMCQKCGSKVVRCRKEKG